MKIEDKVRQISEMYTKRVREILSENRKALQVEVERMIFERSVENTIPDWVNLQNTMDIVEKFITAYDQASRGIDVEENLARRTHSLVKSCLDIDTSKEWQTIRRDIASRLGKISDPDLVKYLIERYGVIGTGEIIVKAPEGKTGFVNDVKWVLYIAAIALNKVVGSAVLRT